MQSLLVAVDGGGSGTRLWVLDPMGRLLAEGTAGPSSVTAVGVDQAVRAVDDAARGAGLAVRGPTDATHPIAVVALAIAGADREPEVGQLRTALVRLFPRAHIVLEHDAVGALVGGTLGEPGVLLLAGTGSICVARGPAGEHVRAGGWGYLLDDAGSGYWIGREGVRRALRAEDGRGTATVLSTVLAAEAGVIDVTELVGPIHRGVYDRPWIAGLAPLVARAAADGDRVATDIVDEAAADLASLVKAVIARSPWFAGAKTVPVVAAGGLFGLGPSWQEGVRAALATAAPRARLIKWVKAPIIGAAYMALQRFHGTFPQDVMANLRRLRKQAVQPLTAGHQRQAKNTGPAIEHALPD